jgi:glycosyltransferase involved in cell wall biosynthesis
VLDSVLAQTVKTEILVMDDASSDGTGDMIRRDYPAVAFHREEKSRGPTFQRNKAAELTQSPVLFTIDDDCVLISPKTIEQTLAGFDHPRVGAVSLPFINILADKIVRTAEPASGPGDVMAAFEYLGGMVAIRRDVYRALGGYRSYMFIQVEEPDFAIRMLDAGYIVRLGWADPLHHMESPLRDFSSRHRQGARNHVLYSYYNVPWPYFPGHLAGTTLLCMKHGYNLGVSRLVWQGLWQGYRGIFHELGQRHPVSGQAYQLARMLKRVGSMPLRKLEPELPDMRDLSGTSG